MGRSLIWKPAATLAVPSKWNGTVKAHDFVDGFGLCSPTRWKPGARGHGRSQVMKELAAATLSCLRRLSW